jgi:hypothetical protein
MDMKTKKPWVWRALLGALMIALGCASWAAWGSPGCPSCDGAAEILRGRSLPTLGILYYSALLVCAGVCGPGLCLYSGIAIAAGVHGGLLAILLHSKLFCAPCIATGAAAMLALAAAIALEPQNAFRAGFILPGAALAVQSWVLVSGAMPAAAQPELGAQEQIREELSARPVERGKARMVIYTRPDCGYCLELERDVMPGITRAFGARLEVERRSAESLPGIPTPTLILRGSEKRRMFPGLPSREELHRAIETVMGENHGHETVFEKSR